MWLGPLLDGPSSRPLSFHGTLSRENCLLSCIFQPRPDVVYDSFSLKKNSEEEVLPPPFDYQGIADAKSIL